MALYQLTLFYPSLKASTSAVQRIRGDVQAIAGGNWRVLSAGEQVCAIGFVTDATPAQMADRFARHASEQLHFLLVEVAAVPAGHLTGGSAQWLASRLPHKKSSP